MYLHPFSLHNLALLSDWLQEHSELYVDVYLPHSGGSGTAYLIRSLHDLRTLVAEQQWPEIVITILRTFPYPLRGVVRPQFTVHALQQIPDGTPYRIIALDTYYPSPCTFFGSGMTHEELRGDLAHLDGVQVGVGIDPASYYASGADHAASDNVFTIAVTKNQNYYAPFADHPEKYQWIESLWNTGDR